MAHPGTARSAAAGAFARRSAPTQQLLGQAADVVAACTDMAHRFRRGGTLLVLGGAGSATDAQHVSVEFVHPVLVGKRALPARFLTDPAELPVIARPQDIALAVSSGEREEDRWRAALQDARARGLLTVALIRDGAPPPVADHVLRAGGDTVVAREMQVTTYHLLWELVHVVVEREDVVFPARTGVAAGTGGTAAEIPEHACDTGCVTCADAAMPVRVVSLLEDGLAVVDTGSGTEEISVALVDATIGDTVLVHAREAISVVRDAVEESGGAVR